MTARCRAVDTGHGTARRSSITARRGVAWRAVDAAVLIPIIYTPVTKTLALDSRAIVPALAQPNERYHAPEKVCFLSLLEL